MTAKKKTAKKKTIVSNGQDKRKEARRKDDQMIIKLQEIVLGMHKKIVNLETKIDTQNSILSRAKQRLGL